MGRGKSRTLVAELRILEAGLWTAHAADLWDMELRLAEKQGSELRILAPDEPAARAAFEAEYPQKVAHRRRFLADLVPPPELFDQAPNDDDDANDDDANDDDANDDDANDDDANDDARDDDDDALRDVEDGEEDAS